MSVLNFDFIQHTTSTRHSTFSMTTIKVAQAYPVVKLFLQNAHDLGNSTLFPKKSNINYREKVYEVNCYETSSLAFLSSQVDTFHIYRYVWLHINIFVWKILNSFTIFFVQIWCLPSLVRRCYYTSDKWHYALCQVGVHANENLASPPSVNVMLVTSKICMWFTKNELHSELTNETISDTYHTQST